MTLAIVGMVWYGNASSKVGAKTILSKSTGPTYSEVVKVEEEEDDGSV